MTLRVKKAVKPMSTIAIAMPARQASGVAAIPELGSATGIPLGGSIGSIVCIIAVLMPQSHLNKKYNRSA
jgi:hypothetical protein